MANDPNRDLLPVKDIDDRSSKGINCRVDHNVIGKLKRCDLEDRYMRLYDENTQIKKQLNCQDEKIKRLGTKLLRLIGEKKNCPDSCRRRQDGKGLDELQMRIIELEHENYIIKDRNVVLKQQLANHARQHVAAHRSPNRSVHNSPRISQRQSSAPNVNDSNYILSNRNQPDIQLREAEEHINGLNEEIKSLHNKIDSLQQDLEKSCLENQKTKVCENIELIRLQRSLKQQSIQIATLQAKIKNAEKSQKLLRDELATAHKENEDSLQVISEKQKEILELYTKLEEKNLNRLEREEMKERINDLTSERDSLRQRGEFLMKTIEAKSSETDVINDLKKLLAAEKAKKEELKQSLENTQKVLQTLKESARLSQSSDEALVKSPSTENTSKLAIKQVTVSTQTTSDQSRLLINNTPQETELELLTLTQLIPSNEKAHQDITVKESKVLNGEIKRSLITNALESSMKISATCRCSHIVSRDAAVQTQPRDFTFSYGETETNTERLDLNRTYEAEKINLERELEYVKQMLRSQTQRCEAQEEEISRLKSDLRVSEEKYNDTLKRLDLHLKIFRHLESRTSKGIGESGSDTFERKYLSLLESFDEVSLEGRKEDNAQYTRMAEETEEKVDDGKITKKNNGKNEASTSEPYRPDGAENRDGRLRFMQRKFLVSSDEEDEEDGDFEKDKSLIWPKNEKKSLGKEEISESSKRRSPGQTDREKRRSERFESDSSDSNQLGLFSLKIKNQEDVRPVPKPRTELPKTSGQTLETKVLEVRSPVTAQSERMTAGSTISICIEWLKLEPETSLWYNDSVKLLFIDFSFLDVKGEETETPSSLKKPKKPVEKCHYNFNKNIEITDYRATALQSMKNRPDQELITFKIVSEPEESNDDSECIDIGVAVITVKQFFESKPSTSVLLEVKNMYDVKEKIGVLSIRLDISKII